MSEQQPVPEVKHTYRLNGEDKRTHPIFSLAGVSYAESRDDQEQARVTIEASENMTVVTYGRKVLEVLNRYEFDQASDNMRNQIEGIVASYGYGDVVQRSYAGRHTSGPVPEQE